MDAREYPHEKSVLLNAAYDVLDRLACPLRYADSRAGVLRFAHGADVGEMEFTAILRDGAEVTRVEIGGAGQELSGVLLDELASALHQNFEMAQRRKEA